MIRTSGRDAKRSGKSNKYRCERRALTLRRLCAGGNKAERTRSEQRRWWRRARHGRYGYGRSASRTRRNGALFGNGRQRAWSSSFSFTWTLPTATRLAHKHPPPVHDPLLLLYHLPPLVATAPAPQSTQSPAELSDRCAALQSAAPTTSPPRYRSTNHHSTQPSTYIVPVLPLSLHHIPWRQPSTLPFSPPACSRSTPRARLRRAPRRPPLPALLSPLWRPTTLPRQPQWLPKTSSRQTNPKSFLPSPLLPRLPTATRAHACAAAARLSRVPPRPSLP